MCSPCPSCLGVRPFTSPWIGDPLISEGCSPAQSAVWVLSGIDYEDGVVVDLSDKNLVEGLRRGLKGVRPSEECYIIFPARYGMGDKAAGTIPAGSPLIYRVWVIDIENK